MFTKPPAKKDTQIENSNSASIWDKLENQARSMNIPELEKWIEDHKKESAMYANQLNKHEEFFMQQFPYYTRENTRNELIAYGNGTKRLLADKNAKLTDGFVIISEPEQFALVEMLGKQYINYTNAIINLDAFAKFQQKILDERKNMSTFGPK